MTIFGTVLIYVGLLTAVGPILVMFTGDWSRPAPDRAVALILAVMLSGIALLGIGSAINPGWWSAA